MIYDRIENIGKYKGISGWFDDAADFLLHTDLKELPEGRTQICGSHVFVNVMEADTVEQETVSFEIHKKYWDIQVDIAGTELIQIGMKKDKVMDQFRKDIDFGTCSCSEYVDCVMGEGRFIICMSEEPHRPTLRYGDCGRVKKCVVKVEAAK